METEANDLSKFVSSLAGGDGLRVEETLGSGFVRLRVSEAERRQAKHDIRCVEDAVIELLRNARDAGATHIFVASSREGHVRTLTIVDDGAGIPSDMHERVFDARVTSKLDTMSMDKWGVHGRGMALFSIRENAIDARVTASERGLGTSIQVSFDATSITERADQSTWPTVRVEEGDRTLRGPRNILRACVEFALESQGRCNVYVGSPSEVIATMRVRKRASFVGQSESSHVTTSPLGDCPVCEGPSLAQDARELRAIAARLGMDMSERNAHRILRGEIRPLVNARTKVLGRTIANNKIKEDGPSRRIVLAPQDKDELAQLLEQSFGVVAERYYLRQVEKPKISVGAGKVTVVFSFEEDE